MLDRIADGRTDLVWEWVEQGGDPRSLVAGTSLLQWCAYYGDVSAIRYLQSRGVALEALGDNFDLNGAAFHGHWRLCQYLLECGADANHPLAETGETALHAALCKADRPTYTHVVQVLLAAGANPNATTIPYRETGCFMRDCRTKGETPLHRAAAFANAHAVELLLQAGAAVDSRDAYGDTPLSWASWHLRPAAILQLLCYGPYTISTAAIRRSTSDHGRGWGNGMEWNLLGEPHV